GWVVACKNAIAMSFSGLFSIMSEIRSAISCLNSVISHLNIIEFVVRHLPDLLAVIRVHHKDPCCFWSMRQNLVRRADTQPGSRQRASLLVRIYVNCCRNWITRTFPKQGVDHPFRGAAPDDIR